MSLYRRGSTWWIKLYDTRGEILRQSTKTESKQEAQRIHDLLKADLLRNNRSSHSYTFSEAVERWLGETSYKASHARDKQVLAWFCNYLGKYKLEEITADRIKNVLAAHKKGVSTGTINCYLAIIRALLRRAEREWEWISRSPYIKLKHDTTKRIRFLTKEEAARLLGELPPHLRDMALFTLSTGLRASNVTGLTWGQVDLTRNHIWILADQAKARKPIAVPLNSVARAVIVAQQGRHESFVFTYEGKPLTYRPNNHAWRKALKRAGISNFRWHDLRHTFASWHIQAGTPLHVIQELGGWASYEMVQRYAHLTSEHLQQYSQQLGTKTQDLLVGEIHPAGAVADLGSTSES